MKRFFLSLKSMCAGKKMLMMLTAVSLCLATSCDDKKETGTDNPTPEPEPEPTPEEVEWTTVELKEATSDCYYFIPWQQQHGNYYIELATGPVGYAGINAYPMEEGDYILCLDLYADADADHHNPQLPAGLYNPTTKPNVEHNKTYSLVNTMAVYNNGKDEESGQSKIKWIKFSSGTLDVSRSDDGTYTVKGRFICESDPEHGYEFNFTGPIPIEDMSGIEDEDWYGFEGNTEFTAQKANYLYYDDSAEKGVDSYILRLFESTNITPDYMHINEPGNKVSLGLYTAPGKGLAGTYTVRNGVSAGSCAPGVSVAATATGTFVERVRDDYGVRYALISEGTVTITENDGVYDITVNCTTDKGYAVKVTYKGTLENVTGKAPVYSTLKQDITFYPLQCSAVDYYGDFYYNGTVNYSVVLANETELLIFDILSATGTAMELPTGTFTVNSTYNANTCIPGESDGYDNYPTCYVEYNYNEDGTELEAVNYAPVKGGTLTITKSGMDYTMVYNLTDDAQPAHTITGEITCTLPEIKDYTQETEPAAKRAKAAMQRGRKPNVLKVK